VVASASGSQLHSIPHKVLEKFRWGKEFMCLYGIKR
jgi:hypothetical protein